MIEDEFLDIDGAEEVELSSFASNKKKRKGGAKKQVIIDERNYARQIDIPKNMTDHPFIKEFKFDKCLEIVMFGNPMSDSRPRFNKITGSVVTINLQKLKKMFKPLYEGSELLKNTCIISHYVIDAKIFKSPTKVDIKLLNNYNMMKPYAKEKVPDMAIKDVDNVLKVYNDLLFADEYRVTIDDGFNIGFMDPLKMLSNNPRIELKIYYSSKPNKYILQKVTSCASYLKFMVSYKKMLMSKTAPAEFLKRIKFTVISELNLPGNINSIKNQIKVLARITSVLEEYPADVLKEMVDLGDSKGKFTRADALVKILLVILYKFPALANKVTGLINISDGVDTSEEILVTKDVVIKRKTKSPMMSRGKKNKHSVLPKSVEHKRDKEKSSKAVSSLIDSLFFK